MHYHFNKLYGPAISDEECKKIVHCKTDGLQKQLERAKYLSSKLVYQSSEKNIIDILNHLSKNPCLPHYIQTIPIGVQIQSMQELIRVFNKIRFETSKDSLRTKEILLSAITILDDEKVQNTQLLRKICPDSFSRNCYAKLVKLKSAFETSNKLLIPNKIKKPEYPQKLFEWAKTFWFESTHPNPNPLKTRIVRNENNEKSVHPQHICYTTYKAVYEDWAVHPFTKQICSEVNKPVPQYGWFDELRPPFVYPVDPNDFSNCSIHSNWHILSKQLTSIFSNTTYHKCRTPQCPNNLTDNAGKCPCLDCIGCPINNGLLKLSLTKFIKFLSCNNDNELYPNLDCTRGNCDDGICGYKYLRLLLDGDLCSHFHVPPDKTFKFRYYQKYNSINWKSGDRKNAEEGFIEKRVNWEQFKKLYIKEYKTYSKHHVEYIYQFRTRRDFASKSATNIPLNALYGHHDWINNIRPESQIRTQGQWSNRDGIALFSTINRYSAAQTIELSSSFFNSDPKHDWPASLYNLEVHIKNMQHLFTSQLHRQLNCYYGYSDRGEFSCAGFLVGLGIIKQRLNLPRIIWTFTCPQHGKCKCDSEGNVFKSCVKCGVNSGAIIYNPQQEDYDVTVIRHLKSNLDADNAMRREFHSIDKSAINHIKQNQLCDSMTNIMSYYSFDIKSPFEIYRRRLDCKCAACLRFDWSQCVNIDICGAWELYPMTAYTTEAIWVNNQ